MEKYYLGKLSQFSQDNNNHLINDRLSKLVEIQFSRRPPTFGVLYLLNQDDSQRDPLTTINQEDDYCYDYDENYDQTSAQQSLVLSGLSSSSENSAKLEILKQIRLDEILSNKPTIGVVVDLDIIGQSLLIEGGSSLLNEQQLRQSICLLLTRDANLLLISMIDGQIKYMFNCQQQSTIPSGLLLASGGHDCFMECYLRADDVNYEQDVYIYVLADRHYYCFSIKSLTQIKQQAPRHHSLLCHYSLPSNNNPALQHQDKWLKFTKLTPISGASSPIVMLELTDNSMRIINKHGNTLFTGHNLSETGPSRRRQLVLVPKTTSTDQQTIILTYSGSKITAYSLLIDLDDDDNHQQDYRSSSHRYNKIANGDDDGNGDDDDDEHLRRSHEQTRNRADLLRRVADPDQLLPKEPSFELERCWSIDLNDIDSIRSLDDQENEEQRHSNTTGVDVDHENSTNGCMCPVWSSNQLNETNCWPKFLLITYKYYLLIYSFEQQSVLPFSVVYDRAFLGQQTQQPPVLLSSADQQPNASVQDYQESIDARMKPKLIHNFKLIGAQPTDLLINTLFLVGKMSLIKAKQFSQLGLVVCLSNSRDLLAFKLTSSKLVNKKDNLYQQLLLDSLKSNSLLNEQIQRLQASNESMRQDISSLSNRTRHNIQQERHLLDNLHRMLQASLKPQQQQQSRTNPSGGNNDGLFQLHLTWSSLIQISRVVVVCTVNSYILAGEDRFSSNPLIKSISVDNNDDDEEDNDRIMKQHMPLLFQVNDETGQRRDSEINQSTSGKRLDSQPIKSMALIELQDRQENVRLSLPIFLVDGQFGEISVYFVLSTPKRRVKQQPGRSIRRSSLIFASEDMLMDGNDSNMTIGGPQQQQQQQQQMSMKYYKKCIQIKPLVSYQYIKSNETIEPDNGVGKRLQIICLASQTSAQNIQTSQLKDWLHECLQEAKTQTKSASNEQPLKMQQFHLYRSSFTHCHLGYNFVESDNKLTLVSDDFIALELIKKHLLKRATDLSIRLEVTHSIPSMDDLRLLVGRQLMTLDQTLLSSTTSKNAQPTSRASVDEHRDILLESLFNQVNMNELPQDIKSIGPVWLEKSFRQDIERCRATDTKQTVELTSKRTTPSQPDRILVMRDIVCGFIIDALVDYDNLHNTKTSSEMMIKMRENLLNLMSGQTSSEAFKSQHQFADHILSQWSSVKRQLSTH